MADERVAYPGSSRRSEQLSCTKFFDPSYGLIYMVFQRFKQYSQIIINSKLKAKMLDAPSTGYTEVYPRADRWARGSQLTS